MIISVDSRAILGESGPLKCECVERARWRAGQWGRYGIVAVCVLLSILFRRVGAIFGKWLQ
jgi:hypothetical protein